MDNEEKKEQEQWRKPRVFTRKLNLDYSQIYHELSLQWYSHRDICDILVGIRLNSSDAKKQLLICRQRGGCSTSKAIRKCGHTSCKRHTVMINNNREIPNGYSTMCYACAFDNSYFDDKDGYFDRFGHFNQLEKRKEVLRSWRSRSKQ